MPVSCGALVQQVALPEGARPPSVAFVGILGTCACPQPQGGLGNTQRLDKPSELLPLPLAPKFMLQPIVWQAFEV